MSFSWIIILFAICMAIVVIGSLHERKQREQDREQNIAKKQWETEKIITIYNEKKNELISKYGQPDKTIILEELNLEKEIIAFGNANRIWLLGKDLPMSDILSCNFNDDQRIEKGNISYDTKISTGNMAKRAIIGGVLTGGVGAIVGGVTANKETIVNQENDKIIHNYTIIININSLSEPTIKIPLGRNDTQANEIVGLMNVIINISKEREK